MLQTTSINNRDLPSQKRPSSKKTRSWAIQTMNASEDLALFSDHLIRQSYANKKTNYDLYNDILDTSDIEKRCDRMGFGKDAFPATMQNYPLANPKIDIIIGEETRRRFDWQVQVVNDEAISRREQEKKEEIKKFILRKIQDPNLNKEDLKKDIERFKSYINYEWQDLLARRATHILNYLYKTKNLKHVFNRGMEDVVLAGEEIYCSDIEAGEPVFRKCNPLNIHTLRSGDSPWIDDADIIIEDGYYSVGQIIDKYHLDLTDEEVKQVEEGLPFHSDSGGIIHVGGRESSMALPADLTKGLINTEDFVRGNFAGAYDSEGNMRVMRVLWKSYRKVGILKYYDPQTRAELEKIVDERYQKLPTDDLKWIWISEWWEGTRIGGSLHSGDSNAIYIKIQKRPIQFRSIHNLSRCHSGYVGLAYNTNVSKAKSLMDRMKPYQYLYNVFMYRTELAFARAKGRIGKIDIARKPDSWTVEQWMGYAEINGWIIEDSFNEATKGAAQGKLAGQMSGSSSYLDLDLGNYIQQHVMMLQFIENQMGQIAGISRQREGQIENRETVRGVERAVSQSNTITEKYFSLHDMVKTKAMSILLETAKFAWKGKEKVLQYVTDDLTTETFRVEKDDPVMDCDQGVILTSGSESMELLQSFKELAHAGLQNDKISFKEIMDIYSNPSLVSVRRKVELAEINKLASQEKQAAQAQEMQTEALNAAKAEKDAERQFELLKQQNDINAKLTIEQMKIDADHDLDDDGINDELEYTRESTKENIARLKEQSTRLIKDMELNHEKQENKLDRDSKEKIEKTKASAKKSTSTKK